MTAILIIISGLILRLFHFRDLFYYAIDEEKAAFIIKGIITGAHFPSVGHPSSIGFRLGPLQYYLLAPFYKLFSASPLIWGYVSVAVSIVSMILVYKIGLKISRICGLVAVFLYSFSYLNVLYDRRGWQLSFHSLIALTILFSLLKIAKGNIRYLYVLTFALVAATHFEVATFLFLALVFLSFIFLKIKIAKKHILTSILIILFSQAGLLFFDLRHDFLNTRYLINYFNPQATVRIAKNIPLTGIRSVYLTHNLIPSTFARTLYPDPSSNLAVQYANCPAYLSYKQTQVPLSNKLAVVLVFVVFGYLTIRHWREETAEENISKIILFYFILLFGGIALYTYAFHGEMAEYYLFSGFAYFFLAVSVLIRRIFYGHFSYVLLILLFIFAFVNTSSLFKSYNPYGFLHKTKAVKYVISTVDDNSFTLDSFETCWSTGGYRYLFTFYGKEPLTSYMDQYMSEYYIPDKTIQPVYKVTLLMPELIGDNPQGFDSFQNATSDKALFANSFGAIEVYINKLTAE